MPEMSWPAEGDQRVVRPDPVTSVHQDLDDVDVAEVADIGDMDILQHSTPVAATRG